MAALLLAASAPASVPETDPTKIRALAAGADGSVWYALDRGVGVLRPDGTSRAWSLPGTAQVAPGWALASGQLVRVGPGGPRPVAPVAVHALTVAGERVWAAGLRGLWTERAGRVVRVSAGEFSDVTPARGGGVWALRDTRGSDGSIGAVLERWTARGRRSSEPLAHDVDDLADDGRGGVWATSIFGGGFTRIDARGRETVVRCADCGMIHALAPAPGGEAVATGWSADDDADVVVATGGGSPTIVRRDRLSNGRAVAVLPDGRVALSEPRAGRLTLLDGSGRARSVRVALPAARAAGEAIPARPASRSRRRPR